MATVFTDEDRRNLRTLAEEPHRLRLLLVDFMETLEVLNDKELMGSIEASERDIREGRLIAIKELLKEPNFDEQEI